MQNGNLKLKTLIKYTNIYKFLLISLFIFFGVLGFAKTSLAANHYICDTSVCGQTPGDSLSWTTALSDLPASFTRGDTYYVADGLYTSHIFSTAVSGSTYITVKKATVADHGTDTGWSSSFGDGQAVFAEYIQFTSSYWVFDGNGTHTVPSSNTADYGFKVLSTGGVGTWMGVIRLGDGGNQPSYITIRYTHSYNTYHAKNGNYDTTNIRFYYGSGKTHYKFQNCFIENSGQDGIQIGSSSYLLFEGCYMKWLGEHGDQLPDYHGQSIQLSGGGTDIIFRYNVFESCEGESLWSIFGPTGTPAHIRFYGNVIYNPYGAYTTSAGYNAGIIHYWNEGGGALDGIYVYNNTIVNIAGTYDQSGPGTPTSVRAWFLLDTNAINANIYNNLFYDSHSNIAYNWDSNGYHASGGGDAAGGTNEQTGLTSAIFTNYTGNNFRLSSNTTAGLTLTSQPWWSDGADDFFGTIDSVVDVYGVTRTTWSRGAYEYPGGSPPPADTTPPTVSISFPSDGATVSGTSIVSAIASDNIGVVGVQFKLDGANLGAEDTTSPYSITWDTTTASNGSHTLTAIARDAAGNQTTSSGVTVTVSNGDTTPPAPPSGVTVN